MKKKSLKVHVTPRRKLDYCVAVFEGLGLCRNDILPPCESRRVCRPL